MMNSIGMALYTKFNMEFERAQDDYEQATGYAKIKGMKLSRFSEKRDVQPCRDRSQIAALLREEIAQKLR